MSYLIVLFINYQVINFLNYAIHRWVQHPGPTSHSELHHKVYNRSRHTSRRFKWLGYVARAELLYLIPMFTLVPGAFYFFDWQLALALCVQLVLHVFAFNFFHINFHRRKGFLQSFRWFRSLKALHTIHHRSTHTNFSVFDFSFDYLFGTLVKPR